MLKNLEHVKIGNLGDSLQDLQMQDTMEQIKNFLDDDLPLALRVLHLLKSGSLKPKEIQEGETPFRDSCNKFNLLSKDRCIKLLEHITSDNSWSSVSPLFSKDACARLLALAMGTE